MQPASVHPIGTPTNGVSQNTGPLATAAWLMTQGLICRDPRWFVEVDLRVHNADEASATLLRIELFSVEWGFWFRHEGKVSWIRVTDVPFVHGRDEHALLRDTPALKNIGRLVTTLEERFAIHFDRDAAAIRTSIVGAEEPVQDWIRSWSESQNALPRIM